MASFEYQPLSQTFVDNYNPIWKRIDWQSKKSRSGTSNATCKFPLAAKSVTLIGIRNPWSFKAFICPIHPKRLRQWLFWASWQKLWWLWSSKSETKMTSKFWNNLFKRILIWFLHLDLFSSFVVKKKGFWGFANFWNSKSFSKNDGSFEQHVSQEFIL